MVMTMILHFLVDQCMHASHTRKCLMLFFISVAMHFMCVHVGLLFVNTKQLKVFIVNIPVPYRVGKGVHTPQSMEVASWYVIVCM